MPLGLQLVFDDKRKNNVNRLAYNKRKKKVSLAYDDRKKKKPINANLFDPSEDGKYLIDLQHEEQHGDDKETHSDDEKHKNEHTLPWNEFKIIIQDKYSNVTTVTNGKPISITINIILKFLYNHIISQQLYCYYQQANEHENMSSSLYYHCKD